MGAWLDDPKDDGVLPQQAWDQKMRLREYSQLQHGRSHNARIGEFRAIWARETAKRFAKSDVQYVAICTLMGEYLAMVGYSGNITTMQITEGKLGALQALGVDINWRWK